MYDRWYIETRAEFFQVLERTILNMRARCERVPALPMYRGILNQLLAMQDWTANGRTPLEQERARIDIGLLAIREIDPQESDDNAELHEWLVQLGGYFDEWPDDCIVSPDPGVGADPPRSA